MPQTINKNLIPIRVEYSGYLTTIAITHKLMKILVIGGAGYIGSHVAREFLDQGHEVTVFDNMYSGVEENIFEDEVFINGDIRNYDEINAVMRSGFDGVVHLAAHKHVAESMSNPCKFALNNICGGINVLNAMVENGVNNIVFSSTATVFGEPEYLPLDEQHVNDPKNFYGFTKLEIERTMAWYDQLKGLKYASLRYFNASGYDHKERIKGIERETSNLIPILMEVASGQRERIKIYGTDYDTPDGSCVRDFIHVNDLATAHVLALEYLKNEQQSQVFNLGTEKGSSVLEILALARKVTGHEIPADLVERRYGDPSKLVAASAKIRKVLGWNPQFSDLNTIVESTWKVYQHHFPQK